MVWHDYRVHFDTFGYIKEHLQNRMQHLSQRTRRLRLKCVSLPFEKGKAGFTYVYFFFLSFFLSFFRSSPKDNRVKFTSSEIQVSAKCINFVSFIEQCRFSQAKSVNFRVSDFLKNLYVTILQRFLPFVQ